MLGLPDDPAGQAELLLTGSVRRVDLLSLTLPGARAAIGRRLGLRRRRRARRRDRGPDAAAEVAAVPLRRGPLAGDVPARALPGSPSTASSESMPPRSVVVANSAYYGKGMKIAPAALIDDGVLDVVVIEAASRLELLRALPTVYDGAHVDRSEVTVLTGKRVELHGDARQPIPLGGDGEPFGALPGTHEEPAVVEIQPGALSIVC